MNKYFDRCVCVCVCVCVRVLTHALYNSVVQLLIGQVLYGCCKYTSLKSSTGQVGFCVCVMVNRCKRMLPNYCAVQVLYKSITPSSHSHIFVALGSLCNGFFVINHVAHKIVLCDCGLVYTVDILHGCTDKIAHG